MRRRTAAILAVGVAFVSWSAGTRAQDGSAASDKEARVRELLKLTGAQELGAKFMDNLMDQFKGRPGVDPGFLDRFRKLCRENDLVERIVPIYVKHLDDEALQGALAFFRTPAGRKFTEAQPRILEESMAVGAQWGRDLAMKAMQDTADYEQKKTDDLNSVRNLVGLLFVQREMPMKDGRVDVYALVRSGDLGEADLSLLRSARFGEGPSKEAIEAGDYSAFPYERFRGKVERDKVVPLLWDRKPDERGGRVVGLSSGAVKFYEEEQVQQMLREHGQTPDPPK